MLLASNIGFLALVAPAQIFYAVTFDPRDMQSHDEYKSYIVQGFIHQCLINTYYGASFVFCFASSSIFRHEISKIFFRRYRPKASIVSGTTETFSSFDSRPFLQQPRHSGYNCTNGSPNNEYALRKKYEKRATESTIATDGFASQ